MAWSQVREFNSVSEVLLFVQVYTHLHNNIVMKIAKNGSYTLNNNNYEGWYISPVVIVNITPCAENTPRRIPQQLSLNDTLIAALSDIELQQKRTMRQIGHL